MSSQSSTDVHRALPVPALLLAAVLLAGCASGTAPRNSGVEAAATPDAQRSIPQRAQTLYEQAVAAMAAGNALDAELRFKEFLLNYPDFPGAWVNLAIIAAGQGDDAAAASHIESALQIDPSNAAALNQLGMLKRRQGFFPEAEAAYMKAVTAQPEYALAHYNLGVLNELYLQQLDTALQHFELYLELGGSDEQVEKWVVDLKRRISVAQRTANVTE
ncbi:MAG TPA: tetratricopeptide repeat protein [Woeseiaceae bacterium]